VKRATASVVGLVLVGAGTVAACGGDDDSANLSSDASVPEDVVVIDTNPAAITALDNSFRPENIEVAAGTEVVWTNKGRNEHNVLQVEGDEWGVEVDDFQPGAVYAHTFDAAGVYRYYCSIHGTTDAGMIGTIVVTE
jgi:plastocyanin